MFSYEYYEKIVHTLLRHGYEITDYHKADSLNRGVILRHDVDFDLEKAARFALFENKLGIKATYFVLVTSNFYNVFSKQSRAYLNQIIHCGHTIGLHFDEAQYDMKDSKGSFECAVKKELGLFEKLLGRTPDCVSMHRPSKFALETPFDFGKGVVNSYSEAFFREYKYLSDSRMAWKEDAVKVIEEGKYEKLHILTHPIWYHESELALKEAIELFLAQKKKQLYTDFGQNFTNFKEVFEETGEYK